MFLKSEEDDRRPNKKKYRLDPIKILIGMAIGFVTPEIAGFLSENIIDNETLNNIAEVSGIGLAIIFGLVMIFVTLRVDFVYDDEEKEKTAARLTQNEVTARLTAYHQAREAGDTERMAELEAWLKDKNVTIKK